MKRLVNRIIEIDIHRSKKNPKLGHAVALIFPCNHHHYLGLTLYREIDDTRNYYKTQNCRVIKFDDYDLMDKQTCKLCPHDEFWIDDMPHTTLDDVVEILEVIDDL